MAKWVYGFGDGKAEGSAAMKELLGGKGANLAEMASLGLPVPPGFTITTEVCTYFYANDRTYPPELKEEVEAALGAIADRTGRIFGDRSEPLLVSVRSGARASMPGMMDTVLNLGLNDETVEALAKSADPRFAWDSYRRFIQMYGSVVLGVEHHEFEAILELEREKRGAAEDTEMDRRRAGRRSSTLYKKLIEDKLGKPFPQAPLGPALGRDRRRLRLVDECRAPSPTASSTTSPRAGARPSTCRRWCSATWARPRPPASPSRAIPRPARRRSTASSWSMRRARTSSPASARRRI